MLAKKSWHRRNNISPLCGVSSSRKSGELSTSTSKDSKPVPFVSLTSVIPTNFAHSQLVLLERVRRVLHFATNRRHPKHPKVERETLGGRAKPSWRIIGILNKGGRIYLMAAKCPSLSLLDTSQKLPLSINSSVISEEGSILLPQ